MQQNNNNNFRNRKYRKILQLTLISSVQKLDMLPVKMRKEM